MSCLCAAPQFPIPALQLRQEPLASMEQPYPLPKADTSQHRLPLTSHLIEKSRKDCVALLLYFLFDRFIILRLVAYYIVWISGYTKAVYYELNTFLYNHKRLTI